MTSSIIWYRLALYPIIGYNIDKKKQKVDIMLSKAKKEEAFYSFSKLLKFSLSAYEHSINNYEVTSLKPCSLQGYAIIDSIKSYKDAVGITEKDKYFFDSLNKSIVEVEKLIEDLKKASARSAEKDRQYRLHH